MTGSEIIKNRDELATTELRRKALDIIEAGVRGVLPDVLLRSAVSFERETRTLCVNGEAHHLKRRIFVIGAGKASGLMAQTLEKILEPDNIEAGIVIEKAEPAKFHPEKIKIIQAGHPVPDERGMAATKTILGLKDKYLIHEGDTVIFLLSGGGSALMPYPAEGISLEDKQRITSLLLSSGADIDEINPVRKHLSRIKGGRLARHFAPARVISLIFSDVIGNDLGVIASGPTFPDKSTFSDAYSVLHKYHLLDKTPISILNVLNAGMAGIIEETPGSLDNATSYIIGDIRLALQAMHEEAERRGCRPLIVSDHQDGDTAKAAEERAKQILEGKYRGYNALIIGGETTPALPSNHGKGGRNQHYAALTAVLLEGYPGEWVFTSLGTDGSDFLPDVAGAIVDRNTLKAFRSRAPDYLSILERYDSNTLLKLAGNSLIVTGDTGTNVGDVMVYLRKP